MHRRSMHRGPARASALEGGFVQRVHAARIAGRDVVLLHVRRPGETTYVVAAAGLGVGVVDAAARDRLREAMRGLEAGDKDGWEAVVEAAAQGPGAGSEDPLAAGARLVEVLVAAGTGARRDALRRAVARALGKIERRIEAVRGDLARAEASEETARRAQLFVAEASRAPRGATKLVAVDWSTGEAREIEMKLDPARPARAQIDAAFQRARRLKEGGAIGRRRLADAESARQALVAIAAEARGDDADLQALEDRARAAAPRDFKAGGGGPSPGGPRRKGAQERLPPYRTFHALDPGPRSPAGPRAGSTAPVPPVGRGSAAPRILVGRGSERNDELTFHVARPHDLWLHAKNRAGAHVVVPLTKGATCPGDVLVDAAHLAAHFSDARGEDVVEVQYTPRRYLRKPRGSAPGFVVVDREKVLVLRVEPERLRRLLEAESP